MASGLPTYVRYDKFAARELLLQGIVPTALHAPGGGSKEHFFHFLLGYLLPVVSLQSVRNDSRFRVMDCGPVMTPILQETLTRLNLDIEIAENTDFGLPCYVPPWDFDWDDRTVVDHACNRVREAWEGRRCSASGCEASENLLIKRSPPPAYYLSSDAEIRGYGTSRRSIVNLSEVSDYLSRRGIPHAVYEPGVHCLGCQISVFTAARRIIAVRGAELANVIWAGPGVQLRVIDPTPPALTLAHLLRRCGVTHEIEHGLGARIIVDPERAARFLLDQQGSA